MSNNLKTTFLNLNVSLITFFQDELASRLSLNCSPAYVQPQKVNDLPVTIINVWDDSALSQQVRKQICLMEMIYFENVHWISLLNKF